MSLLGHADAWAEWRAAMASQRMHHAWILAGKRGIGKGTFARAAAAALVAEPGSHQPAAANHPDIYVLEPLPATEDDEKKRQDGKPYQLKRNISIDQVRRMQQRLVTRPTLGARRAIVIDPIDDLEKSAVNALLKSLEEPPIGTTFVLVAHRPGRLIATVRSRCRMLRFAPLGDDAVDAILREEAPAADAAARAAAIAAAAGSPGAALSYIERDLAPLHALMRRVVREGDASFALRGALAEAIGVRPDRERQLAAIDLARGVMAAEAAALAPARQSAAIEAHAALVRLAAQAPSANFDAGLLVMEIGGLLASAALPRDAAA